MIFKRFCHCSLGIKSIYQPPRANTSPRETVGLISTVAIPADVSVTVTTAFVEVKSTIVAAAPMRVPPEEIPICPAPSKDVAVTTPDTFRSPPSILTLSLNVESPVTSRFPLTVKSWFTFTLFSNVEIPVTFSVSLILVISNSVLPSTSKSAFRSTFPATVSAPP